jgi:hypothetical protein
MPHEEEITPLLGPTVVGPSSKILSEVSPRARTSTVPPRRVDEWDENGLFFRSPADIRIDKGLPPHPPHTSRHPFPHRCVQSEPSRRHNVTSAIRLHTHTSTSMSTSTRTCASGMRCEQVLTTRRHASDIRAARRPGLDVHYCPVCRRTTDGHWIRSDSVA